ncbi:MAG: sulfite exporter TauE/SafE family protein [Parashewanella sp.]
MDSLWIAIAIFMALGSVVGFMAGLLGIGGGLIVVPALLYLLPKMGVEHAYVPIIAIATSLANMILTSISAVSAHYRRDNIDWDIAKMLVPGVMLGAIFSGSIAALIPAELLQKIFAVFVILMAINMARPVKPSEGDLNMPSAISVFLLTMVIACLSGILGIGGAVILIPLLCFFGIRIQRAVGLSNLASLCVAVAGSAGYIIAGWNVSDLPTGTVGYVYLPALFGIALTSVLVAPLGVKAATTWPTKTLKKVFAVFLIFVGAELVINSFSG